MILPKLSRMETMFKHKIILASASKARQKLLKNVGYDFDVHPTNIDEQFIIKKLQMDNISYEEIAMRLSQEKALAVQDKKNSYIIGSDQILIFENKIFSKSENLEQAFDKLSAMQNQTHALISGVSVIKNGKILWSDFDIANMTMKKLTHNDIKKYLSLCADDALHCVGGYAIEFRGARLFKEINGDFFTIMGIPLLKLIAFLDKENTL